MMNDPPNRNAREMNPGAKRVNHHWADQSTGAMYEA